MNIKLNYKFVISFLALTFVMHEAHEIVHTSVGRIICGCWGIRDFNVWGTCEGCDAQHPTSILATFAGPVFTFIMIWIGASLLKESNSAEKKSFGFSLIFANLPFARILTASMASGDEVYGLGQLMTNYNMAWLIGLSAILIITVFPLYKAFTAIKNKRRIGWFLLFFLAPTMIDILIVLGVMNKLVENGVLSNYGILGSPILVTVWTAFVLTIFIATRKQIGKLGE